MKQDPKLDTVQKIMAPGEISRIGFLGHDTRKLVDIMLEDGQTVTGLGFNHRDLAEAMAAITDTGREAFGNPVTARDFLEVIVEDSRGMMACPFGHKGMYPKENTYVANIKTGEKIGWTALNIHMIWDHGFYEGLGSPFRVEPLDLIRVLELETDLD